MTLRLIKLILTYYYRI